MSMQFPMSEEWAANYVKSASVFVKFETLFVIDVRPPRFRGNFGLVILSNVGPFAWPRCLKNRRVKMLSWAMDPHHTPLSMIMLPGLRRRQLQLHLEQLCPAIL